MTIKEVERATDLSAKAIRFYESKGLISTRRRENSYREYDDETVARLKEIKLYRRLGIGISDLKLVRDGVVSIEEVLGRRLSGLKKEEESMKSQYLILSRMLQGGQAPDPDELLPLLEGLQPDDALPEGGRFLEGAKSGALVIGLDIGTTTISAAVVDGETGGLAEAYAIANSSALPDIPPFQRAQDAAAVLKRAKDLLDSVLNSYPGAVAIGVTGQMHGIVYLDAAGRVLSPLYTWQDQRGELLYRDGLTYREAVARASKSRAASGYGLVTHFYNRQNGLVPKDAAYICTVMDCLCLMLTGNGPPLMHATNAASLGCFDVEKGVFLTGSLEGLGIDTRLLPPVTDGFSVLGTYRGAKVCVAIGDNQASFLGSVADPLQSVLVNIGTGSQISAVSKKSLPGRFETRPYLPGRFLLAGSSLCGGRAYALLERFFRSAAVAAGAPDKPLYRMMNQMAEEALTQTDPLEVSTLFCGARENPGLRGSVQNISDENFTPQSMACGVLRGIAEELHGFYREIRAQRPEEPKYLVASGNGVRKNKAMQRILSEVFGMELRIPVHQEEAAFGAALFALAAREPEPDIEKILGLIAYQ